MSKSRETLYHLLPAFAFGATVLGAVHMSTFVWLTAFVYRGNIRGYVLAGLTGLLLLGITSWFLLFFLAAVARRRRTRTMPYLLGGCLAVPVALLASSLYAGVLILILGHSVKKDVAINTVGATACIAAAIMSHRMWLSKRADNKTAARYRRWRAEA